MLQFHSQLGRMRDLSAVGLRRRCFLFYRLVSRWHLMNIVQLLFSSVWLDLGFILHYIIDELEAGAEQLALPEPGTI
jgi:hypothetical protein